MTLWLFLLSTALIGWIVSAFLAPPKRDGKQAWAEEFYARELDTREPGQELDALRRAVRGHGHGAHPEVSSETSEGRLRAQDRDDR